MRRHVTRWLGTVCAAIALSAAALPAFAQATTAAAPASAPSGSKGFFLGAGGGYASFRSDCENCEHEDVYTGGRGFMVDAGWTVNEKFEGGAEFFTAVSGADSNTYRTSYILGVGQFRPWKAYGFYLKGGFGMVRFKGTFTVEGQHGTMSSQGLGVTYGAGWVFGRGRRVSFAPFGAQYVATLGDITMPGVTFANAVSNAWMAGVMVFFR
jgi:hypothetical protein